MSAPKQHLAEVTEGSRAAAVDGVSSVGRHKSELARHKKYNSDQTNLSTLSSQTKSELILYDSSSAGGFI